MSNSDLIFNPSFQSYPPALDDVLFDHELCEQTYDDLAALNSIVRYNSEYDSVQFIGQYADNIAELSLKNIIKNEPARIAKQVIESFHLEVIFNLENEMAALSINAQKEIFDYYQKLTLSHKNR